MGNFQELENNYGQNAQVVYGNQNFIQTQIIYNSEETRKNILTQFCNIHAMWHIEVDYHFRLLHHYQNNIDDLHTFISAITDFDIIYFSNIFPKKLKLFNISQKTAIKRFRQVHKNLYISENDDIFIRKQFQDNFQSFFTQLPENNIEKEDILIYGIFAVIYFYFLDNHLNDDYIQDICYSTLRKVRDSDYILIEQQNIIDIAIKESKKFISKY